MNESEDMLDSDIEPVTNGFDSAIRILIMALPFISIALVTYLILMFGGMLRMAVMSPQLAANALGWQISLIIIAAAGFNSFSFGKQSTRLYKIQNHRYASRSVIIANSAAVMLVAVTLFLFFAASITIFCTAVAQGRSSFS